MGSQTLLWSRTGSGSYEALIGARKLMEGGLDTKVLKPRCGSEPKKGCDVVLAWIKLKVCIKYCLEFHVASVIYSATMLVDMLVPVFSEVLVLSNAQL